MRRAGIGWLHPASGDALTGPRTLPNHIGAAAAPEGCEVASPAGDPRTASHQFLVEQAAFGLPEASVSRTAAFCGESRQKLRVACASTASSQPGRVARWPDRRGLSESIKRMGNHGATRTQPAAHLRREVFGIPGIINGLDALDYPAEAPVVQVPDRPSPPSQAGRLSPLAHPAGQAAGR